MTLIATRRRIAACLGLLLLAGSLSGCATIQTGSHFDETTNFGNYKAFSWIDDQPYIYAEDSTIVSPLTQSMIRSEIQTQLVSKGYVFTDDRENADFVVAYTVGTRDEIRVDSYPAHYRGYWGWHVPYSHYFYREISTHTYTRGTLSVDVFDNESGKPVWHGWAEKTVTYSDRADPGPVIKEGVRRLLQSFPH